MDLAKFASDTDYDHDFNGTSKGGFTFRGAYAGDGTNFGWPLGAGIKTGGSIPDAGTAGSGGSASGGAPAGGASGTAGSGASGSAAGGTSAGAGGASAGGSGARAPGGAAGAGGRGGASTDAGVMGEGAGTAEAKDDGGCSCRAAGQSGTGTRHSAMLLVALLALGRRRSNFRQSG
jgi:MYXO-CTERM domain-containing protein